MKLREDGNGMERWSDLNLIIFETLHPEQRPLMRHHAMQLTRYIVYSGVQRSGDARVDCLIVCPLSKFSIEQWPMIVIVTAYTLFVTLQNDVIYPFAN